MIYADQRWTGLHGIGRFATNVLSAFPYEPIRLKSSPSSPFDSVALSLYLQKHGTDGIFFSPGYNPPLWSRLPFVFTIHDLNHIEHQNSVPNRIYYNTVLKRACARAQSVLTVSEFSRTRILEWSGIPPARVINVGNGVDPQYRPSATQLEADPPYVLCVSNRRPHKNEAATIDAFAAAGLPSETRLVFTGEPDDAVLREVQRCSLTDRVVFTGVVPESELPALYSRARLLVFASLYEGFGLPVVEAMACGTPVVCSNTTSLPEIAGGAAFLVDPTSIDSISSGIAKVYFDDALRQDMRARGLMNASRFSWAATNERVRQVLSQ